MHRCYLGIDGGGTRTTAAVGDEEGRELARRGGRAGIVDPRWPSAAAESVLRLVREVMEAAGVSRPVEAMCAGLAGTGDPAGREVVRRSLEAAGVARRVIVCSDGEIALEGAFMGRPGVLLVAGTGSVAWGRGEDGRVERCGGWGSIAGDEGSAWALGREALRAVLRAGDGRGEETALTAAVLARTGVLLLDELPAWAGRASKAAVAELAREVVAAAAAGDRVAASLLTAGAGELAEHAVALVRRLGPWGSPPAVVLHGGLAAQPAYQSAVEVALATAGVEATIEAPVADAVTGALHMARASIPLDSATSASGS